MPRPSRIILITLVVLLPSILPAQSRPKPQSRPSGTRVAVPPALLQVDDGDTHSPTSSSTAGTTRR